MKKNHLLFPFLLLLLSNNLMAQEYDHDHFVNFGLGYYMQSFSESDEFRKSTQSFSSDEISSVLGPEAFVEFFLGQNLALGFKYQTGEGGYIYKSVSSNGSVEEVRKVTITNSILYADYSIPMGTSSWRLGGYAGGGASTYKYSLECRNATGTFSGICSSYDDFSGNSSGTIMVLGIIGDWGADLFGGRMGFTYVSGTYEEMKNVDGSKETPSGSGMQTYIDLRLAF